ncbi:MAG: P-loop NTPase [Oscillospiraceae bacterium]|nr:P-loop NTPase [Oscillospiraceae bacterium]
MGAQILTVTSGKGGVGKSSLSALLGASLSALGKRVLLMEMDCGLRSLDIMLGAAEKAVYDISDILYGRCKPVEAIIQTSQPCLHLVPSPLRPDMPYTAEGFARICRGFAAVYDYLIVETPAGFGPAFDAAARAADMALIVVTPDLICVRDARVVSDYLDEKGLSNQRLLINRVGRYTLGRFKTLPDLDYVLDQVGEPLLGVIPEDPQSAGYLAKGAAPEAAFPAALACRNVARRLCGEYVELSVQ